MTPAEILRLKDILPTSLGSEELREQVAADILRRSVFSARMASASYLARLRDVCAELVDGKLNQAEARSHLLDLLAQMGHTPQSSRGAGASSPAGLQNPASIRRLNLILDTQTQMAASVARMMNETDATIYQFPAYELTRLEPRAVPRADWAARWRAAGNAVNFEGASRDSMVALKSSPIWAALGRGEGGFKDTLNNPYPPFAFSSGLAWVDVPRDRAIKLGLLEDSKSISGSEGVAPRAPRLSPSDADIADALDRYGDDLGSLLTEGLA